MMIITIIDDHHDLGKTTNCFVLSFINAQLKIGHYTFD